MYIPRILTDRGGRRPVAAALALAILLGGCATMPADRDGESDDPAALYESGNRALESGDYATAIRQFRRLEALHPGDRHALQGGIELVFAYYRDGDPASTEAAAGRFIRANPDHPNLDYLFYLRGLARYDEAIRNLDVLAGSTARRPPAADLALRYFGELIGRYPDSRYSEDARRRLEHLRRQLAAFELEAARQHMNHGEYTGAGLRARAVIEDYPDTGFAADAATIVNMAKRMLDLEGVARVAPVPEPLPLEQVTEAPPADATPPADELPRRESWIAEQDGSRWTIQLFATGNEQSLLAFVGRHGLEEAAYFRTRRDNESWYTLIYGAYPDVDAARAAVERLPRAALAEQPWIRSLSGVQALIELESLERGD